MPSSRLLRAIGTSPALLFALAALVFPRPAAAQTPSNPGPAPWPYADVALPGPDPAASDPPRAPEPPYARFGSQGQVVLSGATDVSISSGSFDASGATSFSVGFSPSVDYFFRPNLSVGLVTSLSYSDNRGYGADSSLVETKRNNDAFGVRLGVNAPLGSHFSFWPTATLGVQLVSEDQSLVSGTSVSTETGGAPSQRQDGLYVGAYAPLLFHVAPHLYVGFGPSFSHQFAARQEGPNVGGQATTFGAGLVVGGTLGGSPELAPEADPSAPDAPAAAPVAPRFAEQGQFVLDSNLGLGLASTSYAGTSASSTSGSMDLGFDYFFAHYVSFGLDLEGSFGSSSAPDANGNTVTAKSSAFGPQVRLGVAIPVAGPVYVYPRANLAFMWGSYDEKLTAGDDGYSTTTVTFVGYVPVVVQLAPHFIAGFGPSLARDSTNTATFPGGQQESNPGTRFGAGFLVGGWL